MAFDELAASPTETELDELDRFLRDHANGESLLLDGVHGLLTALAVGPKPATPEEWLPEVLHAPFADATEGERVLTLLARLNDAIAPELATGVYEPILGELDEPDVAFTARGWCEGFSRGIDLRAPAWQARLHSDERLMQILGPIVALAIDDGVFESEGDFTPLEDDDYESCLAEIPRVVGAVAEYWRSNPPTAKDAGDIAGAGLVRRRRGGNWVH